MPFGPIITNAIQLIVSCFNTKAACVSMDHSSNMASIIGRHMRRWFIGAHFEWFLFYLPSCDSSLGRSIILKHFRKRPLLMMFSCAFHKDGPMILPPRNLFRTNLIHSHGTKTSEAVKTSFSVGTFLRNIFLFYEVFSSERLPKVLHRARHYLLWSQNSEVIILRIFYHFTRFFRSEKLPKVRPWSSSLPDAISEFWGHSK